MYGFSHHGGGLLIGELLKISKPQNLPIIGLQLVECPMHGYSLFLAKIRLLKRALAAVYLARFVDRNMNMPLLFFHNWHGFGNNSLLRSNF